MRFQHKHKYFLVYHYLDEGGRRVYAFICNKCGDTGQIYKTDFWEK